MIGRAEVARLQARLDAVFARADTIEDDQLRADFARYLCVLVCGFLEQAILALLLQHTRVRSADTVYRYVAWRLRVQNPSKEAILQTLGAFNPGWRADLEVFLVGERGDAIGSVLAQRHLIAHGDTSDITIARVRNYYGDIKEVVDHIAQLADPI